MQLEITGTRPALSSVEREYIAAKARRLRKYGEVSRVEFVASGWESHCRAWTTDGSMFVANFTSDSRIASIDQIMQRLTTQLRRRQKKSGRSRVEDPNSSISSEEHGIPKYKLSAPVVTILWDPASISARDYAEVVCAVGDIVREEGGIGIERVRTGGFGVPVETGVGV